VVGGGGGVGGGWVGVGGGCGGGGGVWGGGGGDIMYKTGCEHSAGRGIWGSQN